MDALASLRVYLERPPAKKDKAPTGFDQQLKATTKAATADVWVTLLKGGFQAWYAYLVADPDTRAIVDKLSPPELSNIAQELCKIRPHEGIDDLFRHLFDIAHRGDSRYRYLEVNGYQVPPTIGSRKRRRTVPTDSPDATARTVLDGIGSALPTPTTPTSVHQLLSADYVHPEGTSAQDSPAAGQGARLPFATHLSGILPPIMLSSVVKKEGRAEVEVIPSESPERSRLRLSIYPYRIPYLAKELFDVDADVKDMLIYLRLENGANAKVLELDGAKHGALEKCFGRQLSTAIRSTHKFSTELEQGEVVTKCVSLEIRRGPWFPCSLSLELDPDSLSSIMAAIWPPVHE